MPSFVAYAAALCAAATGWLVRGALAVQSAAPGAPKVGLLPPWWELILFLVAAACVVFLLRPSTDRMLPLFATAICALPWLPGVRSPALLMWTGPLGVALWWGAVAASLLTGGGLRAMFRARPAPFSDARFGPVLAAAGACAFFSLIAFGARHVVPAGDEPHYLIITQSLLSDGDLQIENNHTRGDYRAYFAGTLQPDFWRRGQNGAIYSVHAPGVPALVAPAFLVGGYAGVVVFLILIAGIAAGLLWWLAYALTGRASAAWFAVAATVAATPVAFHSFTVFPDGPAGVIMLTGIWALLRLARASPLIPTGSSRVWALHGLALAVLPWMHTRLAALAGAMGLVVLLRMPRDREGLGRAAAFLAMPVLSAAGWFLFFYVIYGTPSPAAPWTRLVTSWSFIPGGLAGILFDQQFGALLYAPVLLIAAAGWVPLFRANRRLAIELATIAVPYMVVTTRLWIWWGGWSAPARFWTPLFWMGGITAAFAWISIRSRVARHTAVSLLLASALTTITLAYAFDGRLVYNERDGYARWFDWLSTLTDLPLGLPSFFRSLDRLRAFDAQILILVASFGLAFLALRWLDRRLKGSGGFALAAFAAYAIAGMLAVGIVLRLNDADRLRASIAQLRLLDAARDARQLGVRYEGAGVRFSNADGIVRTLRIESPPRLASGRDAPALVLPGWFPAGTYTLSARADAGTGAPYELRVLRAGSPILQGATGPPTGRFQLTVTLPVDTPALILRGGGLAAASLQPSHVATHRERFAAERASDARRYRKTVAWFVDDRAFGDPEGIWVEGRGAQVRVLLQPDAGAWVPVLVRNGPNANEVVLSSDQGDWTWSAAMTPGQEREVRIPVDPARGAVLVRVVSRGGFRPSEIDPSSRDTRLLGVWLSPIDSGR